MSVFETLDVSDFQRDRPGAFEYRTRLLGLAVERHQAPCVLVLDELEQLQDGGSLALLNRLLGQGPPNLHFAVACREFPAQLDLVSPLLAGSGEILAADDLRFSGPDVAQFLGPDMSSRRVASLERESRGWPIALRLLRNEQDDKTPDDVVDGTDLTDNWVAARLLRGLSRAECDLLLDAGLFQWVEAGLLDDVLQTIDAKRRLEAIPALAGLLESVPGKAADALRPHPLIREYCAKRRFRETPHRFRRIHRRIALSLARRGETVPAMRHAAEAGDLPLAGEILENAGGLRLWLRDGRAQLQAADRLLTAELVEQRPRLALARCMVLLLTGQLDAARRMHRDAAAAHPADSEGGGAEDFDHRLDEMIARGMLIVYGCDSIGTQPVESLMADVAHVVADPQLGSLMRGTLEHSLCLAAYLKADFSAATAHAERALRCAPAGHFLEVYIDLLRGQIAMARGEVAQAGHCYRRVLESVRERYLSEPAPAATGQVLMADLNLERDRIAGTPIPFASRETYFERVATFTVCAAYAGVTLDVAWQADGSDRAVSRADGMLHVARTAGLPMLERYLAAERVSLLVAAGRTAEAERAWKLHGLPQRVADCLDLSNQSWLELEAVACAKLRLLVARGEFESGRGLLHGLVSVAMDRDLWRTRMRALALGVALEHAAGRPAEAEGHLREFLRLYEVADYARPLVRERTACLPVLETHVANHAGSPGVRKARRLLKRLARSDRRERGRSTISARELQVLKLMEEHTDREIAATLDLTRAGVRYHVGKILRKLGVRDRRAAVSRAREMGVLP